MATSLVRGRYVVCKVTGRDATLVVDDGAVYQENGTIVEVGPYADLAAKYQPDQVVGSDQHVVVPGFVDAHHHVGLTPFQLGSPDHPLETWFASRFATRNVDFYLDTLYSAFEHLESGVTTVHHLTSRLGPVSGWHAAAERILDAYKAIGLRVTFSLMVRDQNRLVYGPDDEFVRTLPSEIAADVGEWLASQSAPLEVYLDLFDDLVSRRLDERTRFQLTPANLHWCSDSALRRLKDIAGEYGTGMHMHLLETPYQKAYAQRRGDAALVQAIERRDAALKAQV